MLEQVARHGGFALQLSCSRRPAHRRASHGRGLRAGAWARRCATALGDKRGIARYGFVLPMDEARAQVAHRPVRPRRTSSSKASSAASRSAGCRPSSCRISSARWRKPRRRDAHHGQRREHASHDRGLLQGRRAARCARRFASKARSCRAARACCEHALVVIVRERRRQHRVAALRARAARR